MIEQSPSGNKILCGSEITLTITYSEEEPLSAISLFYCSLEPEFLCHFPSLSFNQSDKELYSVKFTPEYESGTLLGYHIVVSYENDTNQYIPGEMAYTNNYTNIVEGPDSKYYFTVLIVDQIDTTPYPTKITIFTVSIVTTLTLLTLRNRKR